jgi:hypothetical protein
MPKSHGERNGERLARNGNVGTLVDVAITQALQTVG